MFCWSRVSASLELCATASITVVVIGELLINLQEQSSA